MEATEFLERLDNVKGSGKGWTARCPAHDDRNNSLSVAEGADSLLLHCFAGCEVDDVVQALGLTMGDLFPTERKRSSQGNDTPAATPATVQHPPSKDVCSLRNYAEVKGLPESFLKEAGLQDHRYQGQQRIRIPYFDAHRQELAVRFRIALRKSKLGGNRFLWKKGSKLHPYGLWLLDQARKTGRVVLVEGESDCHTLWFHELPALGLPGATSWKEPWTQHLLGIDEIYIVIEPDKGGAAILKWLERSVIRDRVKLIFDLGAPDVSDLYLAPKEVDESGLNHV